MIHAPVGRRTVGKTTLADFLCGRCHYQVRFSPRITLPGRGVQLHAHTADAVIDAMRTSDCLTLVPDEDVDEQFALYIRDVRRWYQDHEAEMMTKQETLGVLVDEARFPAVRESRDLDWLFRCTQRDLVHVYLTVHRPKDLHPDIRAIVDHWYVFHVTQPKDLDVIADECLPVVAEMCSRLPAREFIAFDVSTQKFRHWTAADADRWKPSAPPLDRARVANPSDPLFEDAENERGPQLKML